MGLRDLIARVDGYQRRHQMLAFPHAVVKHFGEDGAGRLAATIAYYGFFSLFPLLLVLVTVAGLVLEGKPDLQQRVLDSAIAQFPIVGEDIRRTVGTLPGSGLALAIGIATTVWAGLGGLRSAQFAMDSVWDVPYVRRPSTPKVILRSLLMLASLGVFLLAAALLGSVAGGAVGVTPLAVVGLAASALLNVVLFLVMFRVLTSADLTWGVVWPGAALAGIGWTALLLLGGWIVGNRLEGASNTYGFFAVVIGILAWLHIAAQLALLGAVVNVVRANRLWPRSLDPTKMAEADARVLRRLAGQERRREEQIVDVRFEHSSGDRRSGSGGRSTGPAGPPPWAEEQRSMADVVRSVIDGVVSLVRKEVELAKIEAGEAISAKAAGAGMMAAAGVFALFALGFVAAAGSSALDLVLPTWAAHLIVAGVFLLLGVVLFMVGRSALRSKAAAPTRTQETLKEDVAWAKQQMTR
jgi:YihY family inner membrane protein